MGGQRHLQQGKRMVTFAVSLEKNEWLEERMKALGIAERDLEEKFVRSSGKGGQKVNKTSTCVFLKHLPTGLEVKCMKDRSQSINRFLARRELVERFERLSGLSNTEQLRKEKLKKQKQKQRKRSREKYHSAASPQPKVPKVC